MRPMDILGNLVAGALTLAAISLIVAPDSNFGNVVNALGNATSNLIRTAKAYPTNPNAGQ